MKENGGEEVSEMNNEHKGTIPGISEYTRELDVIMTEEKKRINRMQTCLEMSMAVLAKARRLLDGAMA